MEAKNDGQLSPHMGRAYLREIHDILFSGGSFYHKYSKGDIYASPVLSLGLSRRGKFLICWRHYGASANPVSELGWVIRTIFNESPKSFLEHYDVR